ncbi:hypothetical protein GCM10022234_15460 [Aeromicrobium panaciterrae]
MSWCALAVAALLVIRLIARAADAPMALRLSLGIALVLMLVTLSGLLVSGRVRGDLSGPRALGGLGFVALFLVPFALVMHGRDVTWLGALLGLVGAAGAVVVGWASSAASK